VAEGAAQHTSQQEQTETRHQLHPPTPWRSELNIAPTFVFSLSHFPSLSPSLRGPSRANTSPPCSFCNLLFFTVVFRALALLEIEVQCNEWRINGRLSSPLTPPVVCFSHKPSTPPCLDSHRGFPGGHARVNGAFSIPVNVSAWLPTTAMFLKQPVCKTLRTSIYVSCFASLSCI
jgi:hypothetical protein